MRGYLFVSAQMLSDCKLEAVATSRMVLAPKAEVRSESKDISKTALVHMTVSKPLKNSLFTKQPI